MLDLPRFRLPHWGWLLAAGCTAVIAGSVLSVWLPYYRERQIILEIEGWGGTFVTETGGPRWLQE